MADDNSSTMNLDLNLGPLDNSSDGGELGSGSYPNVAINLDEWLGRRVPRLREVSRRRSQRWRRQLPIPLETQNLALELIGGTAATLETGEGSVANEEQHPEMPKMCETGIGFTEHEDVGKKDDDGKNHSEEGSLFDCNICLELAKDPVVTCCGHLFCWPCLYQWLYLHSDANECPVCKGAVTIMNVTPIYGRGNSSMQETSVDCSLQIPHRPQARRVESWRQTVQRTDFTTPMEEMIRRLGSTYDLSQGLAQLHSSQIHDSPPQETSERRSNMFNRIHRYRGMRRERTAAVLSDESVDLSERNPPPNMEVRGYRWLSSMLLRRTNSLRTATLSSLATALNTDENPAAERLVQSYFQSNPVVERRQEQLPAIFEDRDSLSSIAAVIQSENQFEIDSTIGLSSSSSRRRNGSSSVSVDNGDLRMPRRRRLN